MYYADNKSKSNLNLNLKSKSKSYVELRKKISDEPYEVLEKFSQAANLVKKAKETPSRQVGGGIKLQQLQKNIQTAKKGSLMYGAMLSSVLIHLKKVCAVLRFLNADDLAKYIENQADTAADFLTVLKPVDRTGCVSGAELSTIQKHFEMCDSDSPLVAKLKERVQDERVLISLLIQVKNAKELVTFLKQSSYASQLPRMASEILTANGEQSRLDGIVLQDLQWLHNFLRVFREETDKLQGQKYPTLPFALLATCELRDHCDPVLEDTPAQTILRARVSAGVARKLKPTMQQKIATFLWPQYRHLLMLPDDERDEVYSTVRRLIAAETEGDAHLNAPPSPPKVPRLEGSYNKWCRTGTQQGPVLDERRTRLAPDLVDKIFRGHLN
ncbi:Transposable element Hobo transposase [Frankliniella fusca]|uniref:Transposable element Hobo transposase n=1 Tax=Frankliniella fusca TaxID=407009 RepID=A0AAE1HYK2_9NEOP|nr:Transposable element Hobo transposase [Frankliniella fusca]